MEYEIQTSEDDIYQLCNISETSNYSNHCLLNKNISYQLQSTVNKLQSGIVMILVLLLYP